MYLSQKNTMSSSIQFRFSSSKTYEAVTFSGLMIKLLELKRAIVEKRNLDKGTSDFDLRISNAQTDEVYESDDVMVPKNTSVVVRRVPCTAETGLLAKLEGGARISTRGRDCSCLEFCGRHAEGVHAGRAAGARKRPGRSGRSRWLFSHPSTWKLCVP